jgi:tetratricopeptide (TPR) repeat protein
MAQGKEAEARELFTLWGKQKDSDLPRHLAIGALAAAYDFVGEYERTRAFLVTLAAQQIQLDRGKFDPTHHTHTRAALRAHLINLNFALQQKDSSPAPLLRRIRVAGALALRGNLTAAENTTLRELPLLADMGWARRPTQATKLRAIRIDLADTNVAVQATASFALDDALKINPTDVPALALRGRSLIVSREYEAALDPLDEAIKADPILAAFCGALADRAIVYTKLDRPADAATDTRFDAQLQNILAALAQ